MMNYFTIPFKSEAGRQLQAFFNTARIAERAAERYAASMGAVAFHSDPNSFAGGVSYLEFEKEPDLAVWRPALKIEERMCYEPNCRIETDVIRVVENFRPSDTKDTIFGRKTLKWDDVRREKTLKEWAVIAGVKAGEYREKELRTIVYERLKDCLFLRVLRIKDFTIGSRPRSRKLSRAVVAERKRLQLPVVFTEDLYSILHVQDLDLAAQDDSTPVFFHYKDKWFIGCNRPCSLPYMEVIDAKEFNVTANTAQREIAERKQEEEDKMLDELKEQAEYDRICRRIHGLKES